MNSELRTPNSELTKTAIGGLRLSPMAGFTNAPMRVMSLKFGADAVYTEMAGVAGLVYGKSEMTWQLLETLPEEEGKVVAHLYGSEPEHFARAAEMVAKTGRFIAIDINGGCPVPKVTACGAGSALMRDPKRVKAIIEATRQASGLPVSFKTRIGFNPKELTIDAIADAVEAGGASALTIHGRYKSQGHAGEVSYDVVHRIKARLSIPVYGNGGVRDAKDAADFVDKTGVDGLLIGQAAIGHPWVFKEIKEGRSFYGGLSHSVYLSLDEINATLTEHLEREYNYANYIFEKYPNSAPEGTPEYITVIRFRVHLFRYLAGLKGSGHLRRNMSTLSRLEDCRRAIDDCIECERRFRARVDRD